MKLAFYKGTRPMPAGLFNVAVRLWTHGPYSHVEAVFDYDPNGPSHCASSSNTDGGVRFKYIKLDPAKWDIIDVHADAEAAKQWFIDHIGQPYDMQGLFGFVIGEVPDDKCKWFCSEAVAASIGIINPSKISPNRLYGMLI